VCTGTCGAGFSDCNGDKQTDGCEVATGTDVNNCGGCGTSCSNVNIGTVVCTNGICSGACNPGFSDCNGNKQTDGCETAVSADPKNCGTCGTVCSSTNITVVTCTSGVCD